MFSKKNLYHFIPKRSIGSTHLSLSQHYKINDRIANCLTDFQYEGIRFLYDHFVKHSSCILNLESGLGKTALVAAFLDTVLPHDSSRKCLIIVKNEERVINWQFHLDILTTLPSKVVNEENEINKEAVVFITKWDCLRSSTSLANVDFDCIIIDDRGDLLANKICLAYLLRKYENKISLVISSNDVSIDLRLFHSILRLCGRLDPKYLIFKIFEDKFALPRIAGISDERNKLESYFLRRERIISYCRNFRLREYRHQYENQLPLCKPETYKNCLKKWQETSLRLKPISQLNRSNAYCHILPPSSEMDTEVLFKSFFNNKEEEELNAEVSRITTIAATQTNNSNHNNNNNDSIPDVIMSPLLFEPDSENDNNLDSIVSSTTKDDNNRNIIQPTPIKTKNINTPIKRRQKRYEQKSSKISSGEITKRLTRSMDRLTRSKTQNSSNYVLFDLDHQKTLKKDLSNKKSIASQKRMKSNENMMKKINNKNDSIVSSTSTSLTNKNNSKNDNSYDNNNDIDLSFENGQRFADYINEVEFVVENHNSINNKISSTNCNYDLQCDFSVDQSLILPDSSEINIISATPQPIILLSSSSSSSSSSENNLAIIKNIDKKNNDILNRKLSISPELFSTYDEYKLTCSQQKTSTQSNKRVIRFSKNDRPTEKSCLNILENDYQKKQFPKTVSAPPAANLIICIDNDNNTDTTQIQQETQKNIDNAVMDRNLLIRRRSSLYFPQQSNKITKYLFGENSNQTATFTLSSQQQQQQQQNKLIDTSQPTTTILNLPIPATGAPKTPKKTKLSLFNSGAKTNSATKKSPNIKTTPTTPNSLTRWLTKSSSTTPNKCVATTSANSSRRRRLEDYFKD